MTATVSIII